MRIEDLKNIKLFVPERKKQQRKIADYLNRKTKKIDKAIKKLQNKNKLIKEYKKSLISHVVTGKIKVS